MVKLNSKKGAVELSLNLIIMLIIGMVVLGLVIGFVNGLVNKGRGTFENQIGEQDQLKLDEVSNCKENLCSIPAATITTEKGKETRIYFKVRNYKQDGDINCNPGRIESGSGCGFDHIVVNSQNDDVTTDFLIRGQGFINMKSGEEKSAMYVIESTGVPIGTYYATFGLYGSDQDTFESPIVITIEVK